MKYRIAPKHIFWLKTVIHLAALGYLSVYYYWAFTDNLGADPVKAIIHFTGMGALNLLLLTLCVSPLTKLTKQAQLMKTRRLLGLYSFAYGALHLSNYIAFDLQMAWGTLWEDIIKRPYITVGFAAMVILLFLALTSPRFAQVKLGQSWFKLHKGIYLACALVLLHYLWSLKTITLEPSIYLLAAAFLLLIRTNLVPQLSLRPKRRK